jgi:L-aspartate oxidase
MYLDVSGLEGDPRVLFPSIARICSAFDIDIARDAIPVRPGAHYVVGGVRSDLRGRSNVPGLFVAGEASATGFHGANRMASNSLLEGAVMGRRAGQEGAAHAGSVERIALQTVPDPPAAENAPRLQLDDMLYSLKSLMWRQVGLLRNGNGLDEAIARIALWNHYLLRSQARSQQACELANMLTVSAMIATAARQREESRGTHFRTDHPQRNEAAWCRCIRHRLAPDGTIETSLGPVMQPSDSALA